MDVVTQLWEGSGLYQLTVGQFVMIGVGLLLAFTAAGCAETELASYALKSAAQHPTGTYKVGTPYKIV